MGRVFVSWVGVAMVGGLLGAAHAATRYVDDSAVAGANNGSSWANAYTNLQTAITASVSNDQVWVAEGTYYPTYGTTRTIRFPLKAYVSYYGGFAASETDVSQRAITNHPSILSGDIGVPGDSSDNSTAIVSGTSATGALLDGFTITKGFGTSQTGVGLINNAGNITVRNCIFEDNSGAQGGGMHTDNSAVRIENCIFRGNTASSRAAGLQIYHGEGSMVINCLFYSNVCAGIGGAVNVYHARATFMHCTMSDNAAPRGTGVYTSNGGRMSATNCVFWDVNGGAFDYGGGLSPKQPEEANQGFIDLSYCDVRGGFTAPANGTTANEITGDPLFVAAGDYHLQAASPCIDAGQTTGIVTNDLEFGFRPTGLGHDIGAYEYGSQGVVTTTTSTSTTSSSTSAEPTTTSSTTTSTSSTSSTTTSTTSTTSTTALDPAGDEDGDGVSNGDEETAGTAPMASASYFHFTETGATGTVTYGVFEDPPNVYTVEVLNAEAVVLGWPSAQGRFYNLFSTTNLQTDPFALYESGIPASPPVNQHPVSVSGATTRFFKVEVTQTPPD